jgi:hypothetical protein
MLMQVSSPYKTWQAYRLGFLRTAKMGYRTTSLSLLLLVLSTKMVFLREIGFYPYPPDTQKVEMNSAQDLLY